MGLAVADRGKGIGREFVRWMVENGHWSATVLGYSPAGKATVLAAHRSIVATALAEGRPVSAVAVERYAMKLPKGFVREGANVVASNRPASVRSERPWVAKPVGPVPRATMRVAS